MGINSTDYNLIIVGKYPTSFLSQGQVNFEEWIIYNDESLFDFLRVPDDYIDQIKLTILEIYVRKEHKTSQQCSPLSVDVHPRLENRNSVDGFPITQSTDFPNMTHYQNILIGRYDFDLNETINESDCGLPQQNRNIAPSYGLDNYFGQSSHYEMRENVGTSLNFLVSPTFEADDYRKNITQDEPIDPVNIDDRYLPNYDSLSVSDSNDLPNAEESGDNVPFEASSSDDNFLMPNRLPRPMSMSLFYNREISYLDHLPDDSNIFGDTYDEYTSQRMWREPKDFMNGAIYSEKGMLFNSKKQLQKTLEDTLKNIHVIWLRAAMAHFNLDVEMIVNILRVDIEKTPRFSIKDCQTTVLKAYGILISKRKAYLGRKRAFEKAYGTWEGSLLSCRGLWRL
ncbi:hypothetical protein H5410_043907 [Solanum commersonii]|uniref:Uncharacterized protein n=1 Tax=Solanum commersonii TaxID=4109 RepID=A0A9J5XYX4_SOLCO|nr:hypothetical protein H5410_043907 [Solanum commersonii]